MAIGPSGWTRTTTTRVKSPACCVDTTEGVELIPGIEPGRRPYQSRRLPLHQISAGANGGIRTRTSRLGRPAGDRYPTFASGSAHGYRTRPSALATRDAFLHTQAERGPVSFTGPSRTVSFQRPRSCEPGGRQGIRTQTLPQGERVYGPSADHPLMPPSWRQRQDSNPDPRALEARMLQLHHAAVAASRLDRFRDRTSP